MTWRVVAARRLRVRIVVRPLPMQSPPSSSGVALGHDPDCRSTFYFSQSETAHGLEIRNSDGCGLGVFALHDIAVGERLLIEPPLLAWSKERDGDDVELMEAAVRRLRSDARDAYWSLCQNAEHGATKNVYGIWLSNALPTEDEPATAAVFRIASRLNHSCRPNAHIAWQSQRKRMVLHAVVAIPKGSEVCIDYRGGGDGETRDERRSGLQSDFGFVCTCALCSLTGSAQRESDRRQARIAELFGRISASPTPRNLVRLAEERLSLLALEGIWTTWDTYGAAMSYLQCMGEAAHAARWAARAASCAACALGRDSDEFRTFTAGMAGLEGEWLKAGRSLQSQGYAILDGFAGASAAIELHTQLSQLYRRARSTGHSSSSSSAGSADGGGGREREVPQKEEDEEFSYGQIGGGSDGRAADVQKDASIRGDRRALIEVDDPRAPALRALFFLCDQLVGHLAATGTVPELRSVKHRSRPMLACYEGEAARYVTHVDNPDDNGRLVTCIYYVNEKWEAKHGGELMLYPNATRSSSSKAAGVKVEPVLDRLVLFWSDARVPHEVLPAHASRLAVSSWYHHRTV